MEEWPRGRGRAEAAGADSRSEPAHQHLDPGLPGRRGGRPAGGLVRGGWPDGARRVGSAVWSGRRRRQPDPLQPAPAHRRPAGGKAGARQLPHPRGRRRGPLHRAERVSNRGHRDLRGDGDLLAGRRARRRRKGEAMKVKVWGARGSVPAPGPEMNRYGGNTSCVGVTFADGDVLILDAGTGIRTLGVALAAGIPNINILLTHLHLDHIQGLMFFPPCFRTESRITIWGPSSPEASLEHRVARYISAPLSPVEVRELPCDVSFRDTPASEWEIGSARIRAEAVTHRGPTLGYRITDGDATVAYIPDHEPGLGAPLETVEPEWISGYNLAHGVDLLIHDCQYTEEEYP